MEKQPFDFAELAARLQAKGLPALEGIAEIVTNEVFDWAQEGCMLHSNPFVKAVGVPAIAMLKPLALGAVDKIDGQPG